MNPSYTSPLFFRSHRVTERPPRKPALDPELVRIPAYTLLTNDQTEPQPVGIRVWPEVLRYTHHECRPLFGGLWRMGRSYFTHVFGACLGPEVFYPVGATTRETWAASGKSRSVKLEEEARKARAAYRFIQPIVRDLGGAVFLDLAGQDGDRHTLHAFLPVAAVVRQFTPGEWFTYWRLQDDLFHSALQPTGSPAAKAAGTEEPELLAAQP